MRYVLVLDPMVCDGCRVCEMVCSLRNEGECNPEKSRIRVIKQEIKGICTPVTCIHCEKALCESVCPMHALDTDPKTGAIVLSEEACIGCKLCLYVCPLGAPIFDPAKGTVVKCDLCGGEPTCVKFCSRKALLYVPADRLDTLRKRVGASKIMDFQALMSGIRTAGE